MTIFKQVTQVGVAYLIDTISTAIRSAPKPPETPPPVASAKCIACTAHLEIGLAYVYVKGVSEQYSDDQKLAKHSEDTLEAARQHVDNAVAQIPTLMSINPATAKTGTELASVLPDIEQRLLIAKNGSDVRSLRDDLERALSTAYKIPEAMYQNDNKVVVSRSDLEELHNGISSLREEIKRLEGKDA